MHISFLPQRSEGIRIVSFKNYQTSAFEIMDYLQVFFFVVFFFLFFENQLWKYFGGDLWKFKLTNQAAY